MPETSGREISLGQRIEAFKLESWDGKNWNQVCNGTTIGYKRLITFPAFPAKRLRLVITSSRAAPALRCLAFISLPPSWPALNLGQRT